MKKIIILIAAVIALAGVVTGITIFANNPKVVTLNSIEGFLGEIEDREEIKPFVSMIREGSVAFEVADAEDENNFVSSEIFFSLDDSQKLAVMFKDFTISNDEISMKADIYAGYDYMYVTEEDVLDGTYGLVRGKMAESFEDSIFAPDSGSEYEIPEEIYDILLKLFETYDDTDDQGAIKEGKKIVKRYIKEFEKLLGKYSEFESVNDDVKLGGESFGARVITVTVTPETVKNALEELFKYVEKDKQFNKYFVKYAEKLGITELADEDADDLWDDMIDAFEELVDDFDPDEVDFKLKIKIITPKASSELLGMSVTVYEGKDKEELFSADFGKKGFKKTDRITIVLAEETTVEYKVSESSSKEYKSSLSVDDEKVMSFKWDKKAGKYTLRLYEDGDEIVVSGKFTHKSGKMSISVAEINDEELPVEVTVTINEKAKLPKRVAKSDVKLITELTEDDLDAIAENFEKLIDRAEAVIPGYEGEPEPDYYW